MWKSVDGLEDNGAEVGFNDNGGWVDTGATSAHDTEATDTGGWLSGDGAGICLYISLFFSQSLSFCVFLFLFYFILSLSISLLLYVYLSLT